MVHQVRGRGDGPASHHAEKFLMQKVLVKMKWMNLNGIDFAEKKGT